MIVNIMEFVTQRLFDEDMILKKDKTFPRISIITPSYNQVQFLEGTILSILNQNYPNLEFIIIDGGSTDSSIDIIRKYEKYITYWVSEPDKGQSDAINKGFRMMSGDIVAWQNSDDIYLPDTFCKVGKRFNKNKMTDLVFGNIYLIDSYNRILNEMRYVPFSLNDLLYLDWNIGNQAAFWSRRVMDGVGLLREDISTCFDYDWFIRLGKSSMCTHFMRDFLGGYRVHEAAKLSTVSNKERWPILVDIYRKNGVQVKEAIPFHDQFKSYRFLMGLRRLFYYSIQKDFDYMIRSLAKIIKRNSIYEYNAKSFS